MNLIEQLESKVRTAITKITQLEAHVRELEEQNNQLKEESTSRDRKVEKLLAELDNLSLEGTESPHESIRLEEIEEINKF